jgi:hypothetical protein
MSFVEYCKENINEFLREIRKIVVAKNKDEKVTRAILCGAFIIFVSIILYFVLIFLMFPLFNVYVLPLSGLLLLGLVWTFFSMSVYSDYLDWKEKKEGDR